ncbi:DNA sulfur modification protein DndB [Aliarcobacter butzleri]|uniref:DNA sulfur modification protein DndB n=1 Tax=Aliarcobacter butzleri TaxID=28197 RepID=UPI0021B318AA|nr:DNA sulfur modification protein DndB [Aliarcobacter butzleri]MCT7538213.1 DGQHR domain-containing protein [Aliarcobacter butzleri]MCT7624910.1 DGQHR domain-containing protein [Aliarcobacter butzleri]
MTNTVLPAIRSHVGDWVFYSTTLSFKDINILIKEPDEIHERKKLSDWIQREAIERHASDIANYIIENEQRFLGSLIIGVYDGNPQWSPLDVNFHRDHMEITSEQKEQLEGKLGYLFFSGREKLFAIDGQHRVSGIKKAIDQGLEESILNDEVGALFVSHNETPEGRERTRRLFTTVNKKAKRVSTAAIIALDEDNGFAILTRRLIDNYWLFEDVRNHISYSGTGPIQPESPTLLTSIVTLYNIIKDLYSGKKADFEKNRPTDEILDLHYNLCEEFFNLLLEKYQLYKDVFVDNISTANLYRNNLLFRPVGQRVFAKATEILLKRGNSLENSIDKLLTANLNINTEDWYHILWNPIENTIENEGKKLILAETKLLNLVGELANNGRNQENLDSLLSAIP